MTTDIAQALMGVFENAAGGLVCAAVVWAIGKIARAFRKKRKGDK